MRTTTQRSFVSISSILLLFGILILLNSLSRTLFRNASVDLTAEKEYTLSEGTENILSSLETPITLKYFYSKSAGTRFPIVRLWGERIEDLLREYERNSKGKIVLETYDPQPDSEEEEWAQKYGLVGLPTSEGETVYIGVAGINARGLEQVIPVLDLQRQQYLEYDLSRFVHTLAQEKKPVVGVLSSLPVMGTAASNTQPGAERWTVMSQLQEYGEVRELALPLEEIPADVEVLVVIHPKKFDQNEWYAVDQFVMRGGRLLLFSDPYSAQDVTTPDPQNPMAGVGASRSSSPNPLLSAWGVTQKEGVVVADRLYAATVASARGEEPKPHPMWLMLGRSSANQEDIVTSQLEAVLLPWAGALEVQAKEGIKYDTLLRSSTQAALIPENDYRFGGGDPDAVFRRMAPDGKEYPIAMRIQGRLKSAFPTGRAPELPPLNSPHLTESKGTANIIVVADTDLLTDRFSVVVQDIFGARVASLLNDNLNFTLNAVENLSGSQDLISVRSRGRFTRPFAVVEALEKEARAQFQEKEMVLQATLSGINQKLQQLQAGAGQGESSVVLSKDLMGEIKKFRDEKSRTQQELRVVRRELRRDIESLEQRLFLINTFVVPLILIAVSIWWGYRSRTNRRPRAEAAAKGLS